MSYILDALRRADAERGRGAVPGLHTHAAPTAGLSPAAGRSGASGLWIGVACAAAVAVLAVAGTWWVMQPRPSAPAAATVAAATTPPVPAATSTTAPAAQAPMVAAAPAPIAPPAAAPAPPPVVAAAPASPEPRAVDKRPAAPPRERPVAAAPPSQPPAARLPAPLPEPTRARAEPAPREPAAAQRPAADQPVAAPSGGPVFAQADLPESVRTQLPTLKISGATHSNNPAYRMAIVNGQVLHEGDLAAPGLVLERVEPGRTVWTFRGYRYGVASQ
ncbi:hypothetical protein ASF11_00290 [Acidovorax sp. Leaf76]|uniref:general secretion pathway protein GspB n=1 Tax=unclassified Acidovorax TaxID=2684926 RepID=UPI000701D1F0|nr:MULTISPECIES: general secretion pathway protein GspB [unclassified Acidovorax]KQO26197.1 hypothetical protein ASF11_00290 [Acidovorax sp. Leaf76]KQO35795.1 hypothetical protein ASF19_22100 [Acidovorax sp. Leaf84]KQS38216.1 hypothetical protein ASG27_22795 [Acidovorax sp. Leaf191]